jgi:ubiquinone/menaquinone biosynthesis C-methylase UbiE
MEVEEKKFDPAKLHKLNDPERLEYLNAELIWETLALSDPHVLVDIGAGTGFFAALFAKKIAGRVYACDISEVMIAWMKKNLLPRTGDMVIPVRMEESTVPLPEGVADLVYMINLHHELEEPEKVISEAYRLLKRGGILAIVDWKKEKTPEGPPLSIRVSGDDIRRQVAAGGFSNVAAHRVLRFHDFVTAEKIS